MTLSVPLEHVLLLCAVLLAIGLVTVLARRNVVFMLLGVEVMLGAAALALVAAGARWGQPDGQVLFFFVLAMAAAEVSVGLALILRLRGQTGTTDPDAAVALRDDGHV